MKRERTLHFMTLLGNELEVIWEPMPLGDPEVLEVTLDGFPFMWLSDVDRQRMMRELRLQNDEHYKFSPREFVRENYNE